jgi:hypothetical protein
MKTMEPTKKPIWRSWIAKALLVGVSLIVLQYARGTSFESWSKVSVLTLIGLWAMLDTFADQLHSRRFCISFFFLTALYLASWTKLIHVLGSSNPSTYGMVGFVELLIMAGVLAAITRAPSSKA